MKAIVYGAGLGVLGAWSAVALAHHSYAAFDLTKTLKVTGIVKEWRWTNPHSFVVVTMKGPDGRPFDAVFEANGPGYLARQGWKRDSLRVGDKITASIHPLRAGTPGGDLVEVTLPNGQSLSTAITGPRPVQPQADAAVEGKKSEK
jgi:hypothetical protein